MVKSFSYEYIFIGKEGTCLVNASK